MRALVTVNMWNHTEHDVEYEEDDLNTIWKHVCEDFPDMTSVVIVLVKQKD